MWLWLNKLTYKTMNDGLRRYGKEPVVHAGSELLSEQSVDTKVPFLHILNQNRQLFYIIAWKRKYIIIKTLLDGIMIHSLV